MSLQITPTETDMWRVQNQMMRDSLLTALSVLNSVFLLAANQLRDDDLHPNSMMLLAFSIDENILFVERLTQGIVQASSSVITMDTTETARVQLVAKKSVRNAKKLSAQLKQFANEWRPTHATVDAFERMSLTQRGD